MIYPSSHDCQVAEPRIFDSKSLTLDVHIQNQKHEKDRNTLQSHRCFQQPEMIPFWGICSSSPLLC